jgi:hypothetical protein
MEMILAFAGMKTQLVKKAGVPISSVPTVSVGQFWK